MSTALSCLPSPVYALFSSTQTTPLNLPPSTMGTSMGAMWLPYFSVMVPSALAKLALSRSIWLTTIMRAVWVLSHIAHAFSAPTLRPETAPTVISAASLTAMGPTCSPGKVKVTGHVDQVDLGVLPLQRRHGGADGDVAAHFLLIVVGGGAAILDAALTVDHPGGKQQRFDQRGLALAAVAHDAEVADILGLIVFHEKIPPVR